MHKGELFRAFKDYSTKVQRLQPSYKGSIDMSTANLHYYIAAYNDDLYHGAKAEHSFAAEMWRKTVAEFVELAFTCVFGVGGALGNGIFVGNTSSMIGNKYNPQALRQQGEDPDGMGCL